ncbi:MAG: transcriptional regulator [Candidatus Kerfeldbacteria bacterium CG_4_10_14_0_8_um_filter_42_10]|uniref:Transcriptional regulator n=1 Tax=Candidatus Kerfeldbacteria bacterium CG_4_10_14_0_8_um_filter_42_10 TaxID=2014248 RepID=A0A2M7RIW1_9BACT|nr:MAG: transcriptional regulator [Candidatus Kerfeldbacteria bacterium CG_4_10_14_0_8_um_filter_42_10]
MAKSEKQSNVQSQLHRIIGQLRGLEKMIVEKRDCEEIIIQLMAARAALEKLGVLILHDETSYCFVDQKNPQKKLKNLEKITTNLFKLT